MTESNGASGGAPADLVLTGASVYAPARPGAPPEAVAISGSRILAVGGDEEVRGLVGPRTDVVALPGGMIVPGFQDAHVHPSVGGLDRLRCDLHDAGGREEYREAVSAYAGAHPEAEWILGGGWAMPAFPGGTPRREDLDDIVPDRPVFLVNADVHGAWVNSRALEIAGVTRDTPDPADGRIERDDAGEPLGTLQEGAMDLVERILPPTSPEELESALRVAQSYLHSLGITAWQDAIVTSDILRAYRALAERGELTARVVAALWWERDRGEEQVEDLLEQREWGTVGNLRATTVKIMQDGVVESGCAAMLEPYLDASGKATGNRGISFVDPEALKAHVTRLDREGFQVHFHAIGDRAVRESLDAVEAAIRANGRRDARHHIAHLQVVHPDDVPRFRALDVVANCQPFWACEEPQLVEMNVPVLGPERTSWMYPFGSLLGSGARLAFGSDWSVSTPNPLLEMEVAVTRTDPERRDNDPFLPGERLEPSAALRAFLEGSAYVNHLDRETGSIERGKEADLVVLDRDLSREPGPIGEARVALTIAGGRVVFEEPGLL